MKMLMLALLVMIVSFLYAICRVSSNCSRLEEMEGKDEQKRC